MQKDAERLHELHSRLYEIGALHSEGLESGPDHSEGGIRMSGQNGEKLNRIKLNPQLANFD